MVDSGNPAAQAAAYDDPKVRKAFPMADLIRDSINDAGPRPVTPYYNDVSTSVQLTWHPPRGRARTRDTRRRPTTFMTDVLHGDAAAVTAPGPVSTTAATTRRTP